MFPRTLPLTLLLFYACYPHSSIVLHPIIPLPLDISTPQYPYYYIVLALITPWLISVYPLLTLLLNCLTTLNPIILHRFIANSQPHLICPHPSFFSCFCPQYLQPLNCPLHITSTFTLLHTHSIAVFSYIALPPILPLYTAITPHQPLLMHRFTSNYPVLFQHFSPKHELQPHTPSENFLIAFTGILTVNKLSYAGLNLSPTAFQQFFILLYNLSLSFKTALVSLNWIQ